MRDLPFRDAETGAEAYRRDLLRDRRAQLADVPPAIRAVFVRRCGRIGAALAGGVGGLAFILASLTAVNGHVPDALTALFPGPAPAVLTTLFAGSWLAAALGLLVGRLVGERLFVRALARAFAPGGSAVDDIDRLERETPLIAAQRLALRLEGAATVLPLVTASLLLPATSVLLWVTVFLRRFPSVDILETMLASSTITAGGVIGALHAFWVGAAVRRRRAPFTRRIAILAGLGTLAFLTRSTLSVAVAPILVAGAAALFLAAREHALLGDLDGIAADTRTSTLLAAAAARAFAPVARAARKTGALAVRLVAPLFARRVLAVTLVALFLAVSAFAVGLMAGAHRQAATPLPALVEVPVAAAVDSATPTPLVAPQPEAPAASTCACPPQTR